MHDANKILDRAIILAAFSSYAILVLTALTALSQIVRGLAIAIR